MGVSIHGSAYDVASLLNEIEAWVGDLPPGKIPVREFVRALLPHFGLVENGKFYTVWNEYYEEYNPAYEFGKAIAVYYRGVEDEYDEFYSSSYQMYSSGANAVEVLEEILGEEYE